MPIPNLGRGGLPVYSPASSTATATNGSRNVAFVGTTFITTDVSTGAQTYTAGVGDAFVVSGIGSKLIESITDATHLVLVEPWTYATQTATANWYIVRNSVPAFSFTAKAIQDVLNTGTDTAPVPSFTADDGTARIKMTPNAGAPSLLVGPTGGPVVPGIVFTTAGVASFPNGTTLAGPALGVRNKIYNPRMLIAQRGTTFPIPQTGINFNAYVNVLDRWKVLSEFVAGDVVVTQIDSPTGFLPVSKALRFSATAGGTAKIALAQTFLSETVQDMEGVPSLLSFDVVVGNAGGMSAQLTLETFTTKDIPTSSSTNATVSIGSFSTTPTRMNFAFTAGQMVNVKNGMRFNLFVQWTSGNAPFSFTISNVSWSKGITPQELEFLPRELDLVRCSKFFQTSYNNGVAPGTTGVTSATHRNTDGTLNFATLMVDFNHRMRVAPTVTLYSPSTGATGKFLNVTANSDVNATVARTSELGFSAQVNNISLAAGTAIQAAWTADAEL